MRYLTDYITIGLLLYFFYNGWNKGFVKTLLGPLSLVIGCLAGYIYFQKTQNLITSLGICIIAPFIINILASLALRLWHKAVNGDIPLSFLSKLSGSIFSFFWGGAYLVFMIVLLAIAPLKFGWFEKIQDNVLASKSYSFINQFLGDDVPYASLDVSKVTNVLQDPKKLESYESTDEFKALQTDKRLQDLLADEETAEQLRKQDYGKLLSNPKMQAVFQDKELLNKLFALNKKIMEEELQEESEDGPGPKVIEVQPK